MATTRRQIPADDGEIEFESDRLATHTDIKDWVPLSNVSVEAKFYYNVLRMHVNRKRGDRKVTATTLTLAKLMGRSRGDKTAPWLKELIELGAVQVRRRGLAGRYVYRVIEDPPPGYAGPVNLGEWYDENRDDLRQARDEAKAKRDVRREAARAAKAQVKPVTPVAGVQAEPGSVTPEAGQLVTPETGHPVTPETGREPDGFEPDGFEPDELNPPYPPAVAKRQAGPVEAENRGGNGSPEEQPKPPDPVRQLVDELRPILAARGEVWKYLDQRTRGAVTKSEAEGRPFAVIRLALLHIATGGYGPTASPMRVCEPGGWWDQAEAEYRSSPAGYAPAQRGGAADCDRCDDHGWLLTDDPIGPAVRCTHAAMATAV